MKTIARFLTILVFFGWAGYANANLITFNVAFDTVFDGIPLEDPIVGTGQISFDDPGNGSFLLPTLTNLSMDFSVFGELFTLADAKTPLGQVLAVVSDFGAGRRFQFSNTAGIGGGPYFGSIDFVNAEGAFLTFEPPFFGNGLDLYYSGIPTGAQEDGAYLATTAVPLPGTFAILAGGWVLLLLTRRTRSPVDVVAAFLHHGYSSDLTNVRTGACDSFG